MGNLGGYRWRKLVAQVKAEEHTCQRCGQPIDWTIPKYIDPDGDPPEENPEHGTIGHKLARATHPHLTYDRANVGAEHSLCNKKAGTTWGTPGLGVITETWD